MTFEQIVGTLALSLGAGFCAGINLYATIGVLGLMSRFSSFDLPSGLMVLENEWVIAVACIMYSVEFLADKFPAVDSAWDSIHTFIRVPAGVALAATALGDVPLEWQVIAGMVGGGLALTAHTTKATTRLAAHSTGTSPIVSPVASITEDVLVVSTMAFVAANPVLSLILLAIMIVAAIFILRTFWVLAKSALKSFREFVRGPEAQASI